MDEYNLLGRILPVAESNGFAMEGFWLWCGSAIQGDDGLFHMFSARWSQELPFFTGYIVASEIVHGVAERPEGPYTFREIVLGDRGESFWDGRMTHNPTVLRWGDGYALFYIGSTYRGQRPGARELAGPQKPACIDECYANIRIGMVVAKSLNGPWTRFERPVLDIDPQGWDSTVVTNPAPCLCPDGSLLLYYRSNTPEGLKIGVAKAETPGEAFQRVLSTPVFAGLPSVCVEDPYVWYHNGHYEMIAKDINGLTCGEVFGGAHFVSADGIHWEYAQERKAYSRHVRFADGREEWLYHLERPNLCFVNGRPAFLCAAYGQGGGEKQAYGGNFAEMRMSKTLVIPLDTVNL